MDRNAEIAARLKVCEEPLRQLKQADEQLQAEHRHTLERKMLLEEEVRFLKDHIYGRSSEKLPGQGVSPYRKMLFNDYIPSRTAEAFATLLIGADGPFRGKLLTDGLELYDIVAQQPGVLHFGCAQHART